MTEYPIKITVLNRKGGACKTTTAANVAASLGILGKKVLVFDLDPQGDLSKHLFPKELLETDYNHISKGFTAGDLSICIYKSTAENVDVIPSSRQELRSTEKDLDTNKMGIFIFPSLFRQLDVSKYDYIIFDPAPSESVLSTGALGVSNTLLIPVESYLSTDPLPELIEEIEIVRNTGLNPGLDNGYIVLSNYEPKTRIGKLLAELKETDVFKGRVFDTAIPKNTTLKECPAANKTAYYLNPDCAGAEAFMNLSKEIIATLEG